MDWIVLSGRGETTPPMVQPRKDAWLSIQTRKPTHLRSLTVEAYDAVRLISGAGSTPDAVPTDELIGGELDDAPTWAFQVDAFA